MQKRKTRVGRLRRGTFRAVGLALLALFAAAGRCYAVPGLPPWIAARGGAVEPAERIGALDALLSVRYAACVTSCSWPYGVPGLRAYDMLLCVRAARWGAAVEWEALRHSLYASDRFDAAVAAAGLLPRLSFSLEPSVERRGVSGYPGQHLWRVRGTALLGCGSWGLAVSRSIARDRADRRPASFGFSAGNGAAVVALNGDMHGKRWDGLRAGFRAALAPSVMMMAGYRFDTEEISFGLASVRARMVFVVSWSNHPIAGQTVALGVGRLWMR